ncbi:MAG: nucleotide exchange factor GrpE [Proteobacteria bacterium]|jgi:molecular chaperone GrpE|nr:nucleotide exchange factor GrpE [Pseudomonadota bacterium]
MSDSTQNSESGSPASAPTAEELQAAQATAEKFKNDYLYLKAEFENYKKHAIKERSDLLKYGGERLALEILGILDNFERALEVQVTAENFQTFVKGIQLTASELKSVLSKSGIQEVPSHGVAFDPNVHEALGAEPTTAMPEGHVVRVFKKPYKLHDKLIRPGQVIVAKGLNS